jgi:hypothetical protein
MTRMGVCAYRYTLMEGVTITHISLLVIDDDSKGRGHMEQVIRTLQDGVERSRCEEICLKQ